MKKCLICGNEEKILSSAPSVLIRNIDLYVIGSEGLNACRECEQEIVDHVRAMILLTGRTRMLAIRKERVRYRTWPSSE